MFIELISFTITQILMRRQFKSVNCPNVDNMFDFEVFLWFLKTIIALVYRTLIFAIASIEEFKD